MRKSKKRTKKQDETIKGLRIAYRHMLSYRKEVIFLGIIGVFIAVASGVSPYLLGRFFDELVTPTTISIAEYAFPALIVFFLLWLLLSISENLLGWFKGVKGTYVAEHMATSYIIEGEKKLLSLPMSFHKREKVGEIVHRVDRAGDSVASIVDGVFIGVAPDILSILIGFTIMYFVNPVFTSIVFGGVVIFVWMVLIHNPRLGKMQSEASKKYRNVFGDIVDAVTNISVVKQMTAESHEVKKVHDGYRKGASKVLLKRQKYWEKVRFGQESLMLLVRGGILFGSIWFVTDGRLSIGELVMFNAYAGMTFGPFIRLGFMWQRLQSGMVAVAQAEEVLSLDSEVYEPKGSDKNAVVKGDVVFDRVGFTYREKGAREVLKDITFSVNAGQTVALVGKSGAGKSTLVDLISGYFFAKGKVLIDGVDVKKWSLSALRNQVAVVPQEPTLLNDTVFANIKYGNQRATKEEVEKAAKLADAHGFITGFAKGYRQKVGDRGVKLSAGQKQRIAIARAFLRDPKILILDEPTSALDAEAEEAISASLKKLMKGRTTFIIAHRLSTVRDADLILVLKEGSIVEEGNHTELLKNKNGLYRHLHDLQNGTRESASGMDVEKIMENMNKN